MSLIRPINIDNTEAEHTEIGPCHGVHLIQLLVPGKLRMTLARNPYDRLGIYQAGLASFGNTTYSVVMGH